MIFIQGFVIYSNPPSACTKVVPPPNPSPVSIDHPISWILLAKRSADCHFQTKIENAQKAGVFFNIHDYILYYNLKLLKISSLIRKCIDLQDTQPS